MRLKVAVTRAAIAAHVSRASSEDKSQHRDVGVQRYQQKPRALSAMFAIPSAAVGLSDATDRSKRSWG